MAAIWFVLVALFLSAASGIEEKIKQALDKGKAYEDCTDTMKGDILFVVDASTSIGIKKFDAMRNFILNILDTEIKTLGPDHIQIGLVLFSGEVVKSIPFDAHTTREGFENAMTNLTYVRGDTNLGNALRYARTDALTRANGMRMGLPHILIVITDGKASDQTLAKKEMKKLKNRGIFTLLVGIGQKVDRQGLRELAPTAKDVIFVERWSGLNDVVDNLAKRTCIKIRKVTHCQKFFKADVVFVLDSSTSLGTKNFNILKDFIINVTDAFDVLGSNGTRVALVQFASRVKVRFGLSKYSQRDQLQKALRKMRYLRGSTRTGLALYYTERLILKRRNRDKVNATIVVLTDGKATDRVQAMAARLHKKKYNMLAVGIGDDEHINEDELRAIATRPSETHVFHAQNFGDLPKFLNYLVTSVCKSNLIFESGQQKLEKKLGRVKEDDQGS